MAPAIRNVLAVLAGVVVAVILIALVEAVGHLVYPLPEGIDPNDSESLKAAMSRIPAGAMAFVLFAWAVGTLAGGWVATRIAAKGTVLHAMIVGVILMAVGALNMLMIPHPLWFWIVGLLLFLPAAYAGARMAGAAGASPKGSPAT